MHFRANEFILNKMTLRKLTVLAAAISNLIYINRSAFQMAQQSSVWLIATSEKLMGFPTHVGWSAVDHARMAVAAARVVALVREF